MSEHRLQEAQPLFRWKAFRQLLQNPEVTAFTRCCHWSASWAVRQESNENIRRNRLNLVQPGQGNTGVTEHRSPTFGQNALTFFFFGIWEHAIIQNSCLFLPPQSVAITNLTSFYWHLLATSSLCQSAVSSKYTVHADHKVGLWVAGSTARGM